MGHCDISRIIAINGAGIGGAALAFWLHRFGFTPVLYERAPGPRGGGYLIDFWGKGYDLAEAMGVLPTLRNKGYVVEHMRFLDARGRQSAHLDARIMHNVTSGRYMSIARAELATTLLGAVPDVPPQYGCWVQEFRQDDGGVTLHLSDGRSARAGLLIGADGLHSSTRKTLFGGPDPMVPLGYQVAAAQVYGYGPRDALSYMSHTVPGRQLARFSMRDDATLLFFVMKCANDATVPQGDDAVRAHLQAAFGAMGWEAPQALKALVEVADIYCDSVAQIRLPQWAKGRVALLGDAAACASLLAGEGSGLAIISAYVLAVELERAKGDHGSAFSKWQARMQPFVLKKQKAALGFGGFFAPSSAVRLWMRDMGVRALGLPGAQYLLRRQFRDDIDLPPMPDVA